MRPAHKFARAPPLHYACGPSCAPGEANPSMRHIGWTQALEPEKKVVAWQPVRQSHQTAMVEQVRVAEVRAASSVLSRLREPQSRLARAYHFLCLGGR